MVSWGIQSPRLLGRTDIAGNGYASPGWVSGLFDGLNIIQLCALSAFPFEGQQPGINAAISSHGSLFLWGDSFSTITMFSDISAQFVLLNNKGSIGLGVTKDHRVFSWSVASSTFFLARPGVNDVPAVVAFQDPLYDIVAVFAATRYGVVVNRDIATRSCMLYTWGSGLETSQLPSKRRPGSYNFTALIRQKFGGVSPFIQLIDGGDTAMLAVENEFDCVMDATLCVRPSRLFCMICIFIDA